MKHILIDCDTGIDDSIAILYALKSKKIHVEGITTVYGNTSSHQAAENTLRLVKLSNCGYEVPVILGANHNLDGEYGPIPTHIHGDNGIGNVELPQSEQRLLEESAPDFILRKANELQGDLIIVALGRLTNLALALEKDPRLPYKVKRLVIMGGTLDNPGNVTPYAEANIFGDARAADIVFRAGFHMTVVGLDVTTKTYITKQDMASLENYCANENKEIVKYIQSALEFYFKFNNASNGDLDRCVVHDPLAMVIAENPSLGEYRMLCAGVEYGSKDFRGMIKIDERFVSDYEQEEILFCHKVNSDMAVRRLLSVF